MSELTHTFTQPLKATPERAFEALTRKADLEVWFAEHVDIDAKAGGHLRVWGRHTHGAPAHPGISGYILSHEPGRQLAFSWPFEGQASTIDWTLVATEEGCALNLRHHFPETPERVRFRELIDDLWRLHLGALSSHLAGLPVELPDFADPNPAVSLSILIDAPREAVWRSLTRPDLLDQWLTKAAVIDLEAGLLDFGWSYEVDDETITVPPMRLLEVIENEKLVMEWRDWRGDPAVPHQRVSWTLSDEGMATRVSLTHDGFTRTVDISDYPFGWVWFLDRLAAVALTAAD